MQCFIMQMKMVLKSETVAGLVNVKTKNKLREEAEILHFMPKTSKLPI